MVIRRLPALNNLSTTLTFGMAVGSTDIFVDDASGWPTEGILSICEEIIYYENLVQESPGGWHFDQLTRGYDNTTPAAHSAGNKVQLRFIAEHLDEIWDAFDLRESTFQHAYNDATTKTLMSFPSNYLIKEIEVVVLTAFDPLTGSPPPHIWLGTAADPDRFFDSDDIELDQQGTHFSRVHAVPGPFDLILDMNPGAATQGEVLITVKGTELLP